MILKGAIHGEGIFCPANRIVMHGATVEHTESIFFRFDPDCSMPAAGEDEKSI